MGPSAHADGSDLKREIGSKVFIAEQRISQEKNFIFNSAALEI
jgi:hypothetical protein